MSNSNTYFPKDFIETAEGLLFAVVEYGVERDKNVEKVLCFLRYKKAEDGDNRSWQKLNTGQANDYLDQFYPQYLHHSSLLDVHVHAVPTAKIVRHHQPKQRLQEILSTVRRDRVEQDVADLCTLFNNNGLDLTKAGITGSVLINAQNDNSDIDLVFYDRAAFHQARSITAKLIDSGQLKNLAEKDWEEAYARRSCALNLNQYVWHEQRKFNKAVINNRKFDLNFVTERIGKPVNYHKLGKITVQSKVTDDWFSFDYPALYAIDHDEIKSVACFIATYTGQAVVGETVEISGLLEQSEQGDKRIVVGSSREAPGEYIKVIHG